jgi:serine/threonine-protein kinase
MRHAPLVVVVVLAALMQPALGQTGQLTLVSPLALSPGSPGVNQTTTGTFTVKNTGTASVSVQSFLIGARDPANHNVDFPESAPITLAPGQSYTYMDSRTFATAGTYSAWPAYFDGTNWFELATNSSFTVQQLSLTAGLALSPGSPAVNQSTTATFTVANLGGSAVGVQYFLVGARNPSNGNVYFPTSPSITLQPGQSYTYSGARSFSTTGTYTAWPAYFDGTDWIEMASRASFSVVPGGSGTLFPATAPWYQDISSAPLDPESGPVIAALAASGWGRGRMEINFDIEVLRADPSVAPRTFEPNRPGEFFDPDCDVVPVPVPPGGRLEGETDYACTQNGDCHLIVIQGTNLFEMWRANISGGSSTGSPFTSGCVAKWDTTRDYWQQTPNGYARGDQCTSADAAGFPITALLFNADEVQAGAINHAIRFILPNDRIRRGVYVHPATHVGGPSGGPTAVPYGARLRLKPTFNLAGLPNEGARVVARAMQRYGMFLADGGVITLTAQQDTFTQAKWSGLLGALDLAAIQPGDFEMIDGGTRIPAPFDCVRTP